MSYPLAATGYAKIDALVFLRQFLVEDSRFPQSAVNSFPQRDDGLIVWLANLKEA